MMRMVRRDGAARATVAILSLGAAGLVGAAVAVARVSGLNELLIALIALLLMAPLALRIARGNFDIFEPLTLVNAVLFFMFVLRPAADIVLGFPALQQHEVEPAFQQALLIVIAAIVAYQVGYFLPWGAGIAAALPAPSRKIRPGRAVLLAAVLTVVAVLFFGLFAVASGGASAIAILVAGKSAAATSLYAASTGYLYAAPDLAIPAALVLFSFVRPEKRIRLGYAALALVPTGIAVVSALPQGNRTSLLLLVVPLVSLWYLQRRRRPGLVIVVIALWLLVSVGGYITQTRFASERGLQSTTTLSASLMDPVGSAQEFVIGPDGEEFDTFSVLLQNVPSTIPFAHGATLADLVTRAIPRTFWPDKPLERSDALTVALFPQLYAANRSGPLPSMIGILYMDTGIVTVLLGMFALGLFLSIVWSYFKRYESHAGTQMLYAMFLPVIILVMRDSPGEVLGSVALTVVPLWLVLRLSSARDASVPHATRERPGMLRPSGRGV